MRIALVSLNQHWEDKASNKKLCELYCNYAAENEVDIIIFPEMTLTGFSMNPKLNAEILNNSDSISFFKELSFKNKQSIVFGLCLKEKKGFSNSAVFISKEGKLKGIYRKIHPFSFASENLHFTPGNKTTYIENDGIHIGLTICYDLRFPELFRLYSKKSSILINIANWPEKRIAHWEALLKARAIENQFFMIGVNRTGFDNNNISYTMSSQIISPEGVVLSPFKIIDDISIYDINVNTVKIIRKNFPVLNDCKIEIIKKIK